MILTIPHVKTFTKSQLIKLLQGVSVETICANTPYYKLIDTEFECYIIWNKLNGHEWSSLLGHHPRFADKCDWAKLGGGDWAFVLTIHPQFADKCDWDKFNENNWARLLSVQPQFADRCDWTKLGVHDWDFLLITQPQFAQFKPGRG